MNRTTRSTRPTTPLAHSQLTVTIIDLVAEYALTHVFRNAGTTAIEAVYSFPVPLDAAFMGMEARLAGQHRVAQVVARSHAARRYDEAMADGDSAVLLEQVAPGLLCVNLGNLKPGEEGEIKLRFAAPLACADGAARFSLPLAYRPRYGRSEIDPLAEPSHDFAVEHLLQASIHVQGLLARAPVSCASHAARFQAGDFAQDVQLNQAMLDRDLVLVFDLPPEFSGEARLVRDGDKAIGLLSCNLPASLQAAGPCDLQLLLDCSGSMQGDAIAQSRAALRAVAEALGDADCVQVLRFGSSTQALFRRPLKASQRVREALLELAVGIDANLGGTEMGAALDTALDGLAHLTPESQRSRAIILVTDGAVQPRELARAQARAQEGGIRIFVVAVGSSAGVEVLAPLARATGGVLERAVPAEPIDAAVMRQLRRARQAAPLDVEVDWGSKRARALPLAPAYAGDALRAVATLPAIATLRVNVRVVGEDARHAFVCEQAEELPALRALAGLAAWQHATDKARRAVALRFGLVTPDTSAVLVAARAEADKVEGLPQVRPVSHMLPAGLLDAPALPAPPVKRGQAWKSQPVFLRRRMPDLLNAAVARCAPAGYEQHVMEDDAVGAYTSDAQHHAPDPAMLQALVDALLALLLDQSTDAVSTDALLAVLAPVHRVAAAAWLAQREPQGLDHTGAVALLRELLDTGLKAQLSDEQEADLACLLGIVAVV